MPKTERERIAAKVRALLAKTVENGCTEDEAVAAAEKVAELLAEHNMTVDEAELRESPFVRHRQQNDDPVGRRLWKIAKAIDVLVGTQSWAEQIGAAGEVNFFGFKHEVEIATYLLAICDRAMRGAFAARRAEVALLRKERRRPILAAFLDGMADRLALRIIQLKPKAPPGTGLVVVRNELILQAMQDEGLKLRGVNARQSRKEDPDYAKGAAAAESVALNRGLSGGAENNPRKIGRAS